MVVVLILLFIAAIVSGINFWVSMTDTKSRLQRAKKYPLQFKFETFKDIDSEPYTRLYYRIKPSAWPWYARVCPDFYEWDALDRRFKSIEEAKARATEMSYPYYFSEKIDTQIFELND